MATGAEMGPRPGGAPGFWGSAYGRRNGSGHWCGPRKAQPGTHRRPITSCSLWLGLVFYVQGLERRFLLRLPAAACGPHAQEHADPRNSGCCRSSEGSACLALWACHLTRPWCAGCRLGNRNLFDAISWQARPFAFSGKSSVDQLCPGSTVRIHAVPVLQKSQ